METIRVVRATVEPGEVYWMLDSIQVLDTKDAQPRTVVRYLSLYSFEWTEQDTLLASESWEKRFPLEDGQATASIPQGPRTYNVYPIMEKYEADIATNVKGEPNKEIRLTWRMVRHGSD